MFPYIFFSLGKIILFNFGKKFPDFVLSFSQKNPIVPFVYKLKKKKVLNYFTLKKIYIFYLLNNVIIFTIPEKVGIERFNKYFTTFFFFFTATYLLPKL